MAEEIKTPEKENNLKQVFNLLKKYQNIFVYICLIAIIIYSGIYVRTLNIPGLKDAATGNMTLAPDLDPYLYLRWSREILSNGSLPVIDTMRYVPLGYDTTDELILPCYLIIDLYKFLNLFSPTTIEYAAIIYPVIFFCLFLIAFFLFVNKLFSDYPNSKLIAIISTTIVSIVPGLLHRTLAGVPEKESAGLFYMFLTLYFLISAFKEEKKWKAVILGLLAGTAMGLMGLVWGGVTFLFMSIPIGAILIFFLSDIKNKDVLVYTVWALSFTLILLTQSTRYGLKILSPLSAGTIYFTVLLLISGKIFKKKAIALIVVLAIVLAGILITNPQFSGKGFFAYMMEDVVNAIIKPFITDRLTLTVAENQVVYFSQWFADFGEYVFWFFILGLIFLAYETFWKFEMSGKITASSFMMFIMIMIFSRYSATSQSTLLFVIGVLIFIGGITALTIKRNKDEKTGKKEYVDKGILIFMAVIIFSVFCSRSAVRLYYFIYPIVPIVISFLFVRLFYYIRHKDEILRYTCWLLIGLMIITVSITVIGYNSRLMAEAKGSTTGYYDAQWQYAMAWVRDNTPTDAVFAHWWDYGYWVQTIGGRATILDGGNVISYWDYLMGGKVLTADVTNSSAMNDEFSFLKTHDANYLLIDSTDIGKYGAYSSIGSNENYDKMSSMQTFVINQAAGREERNDTLNILMGANGLDEDLSFDGQIYPAGQAAIFAFIIPVSTINSNNVSVGDLLQPKAMLVYNGKQIIMPIKCVYINNARKNFAYGINGCLYIMPIVTQTGVIDIGAGLWLSERLMRSEMIHLYILDENIPGFINVHSENSPIVNMLNDQYNLGLPEIIYHQQVGLLGPIKIWQIDYSAYPNAQVNPQYLSRVYPEKELWQVNR